MRKFIDNIYLMYYMGKNTRLLAEERFDRKNSYNSIIDKIKKQEVSENGSAFVGYEFS